jgi:multidrug resistance efflux pump
MTLPLPKRTWGIGVFKPGNTVNLYALESGLVASSLPDDGALVEEGECVLILYNPSLTKEQLRLKAALEQAHRRLKFMDTAAYHNLQILDQKKAAELRMDAIRIQAEELDRRIQSLVVNTQARGIFKANLAKSVADSGLLNQASYQSDRYLVRSRSISSGEFVPKDTLIGWVITDSDPHIECEVSRDQMDFVNVGTPVSIRMHSNPKRLARGIVTSASSAVVANSQHNGMEKASQQAIGRVLLRIDSEDLRSLSQVHGGVELLFHHFDQSMWDYLKDAILRNARWR